VEFNTLTLAMQTLEWRSFSMKSRPTDRLQSATPFLRMSIRWLITMQPSCQEAQTVLRAASVGRENPLRSIGQPPKLFKTVPMASLANPGSCAKAWRDYTDELTK
jgi:hypothetical protein